IVRISDDGAALVFRGRVRGRENGRAIVALDYEQYEGMATRELHALAEQTAERFSLSRLWCTHRVGRVPAGEASIEVAIDAPHRAEAIEALAWFITELKSRVPLWKWGVTADGERFACDAPGDAKAPRPGDAN
ncbi:molybdenum cofactor biosynthesis protein MoaE, partial [bacterium]|nr:molybdenum cofactor biosynthesis protein MoaE [bacterium]